MKKTNLFNSLLNMFDGKDLSLFNNSSSISNLFNDYKKSFDELMSAMKDIESKEPVDSSNNTLCKFGTESEQSTLNYDDNKYEVSYTVTLPNATAKEIENYIVDKLSYLNLITSFLLDEQKLIVKCTINNNTRTFYWCNTDKEFCELDVEGKTVINKYNPKLSNNILPVKSEDTYKQEKPSTSKKCYSEPKCTRTSEIVNSCDKKQCKCGKHNTTEKQNSSKLSYAETLKKKILSKREIVFDDLDYQNIINNFQRGVDDNLYHVITETDDTGDVVSGISVSFEEMMEHSYNELTDKIPFTHYKNWYKNLDWDKVSKLICDTMGFTDCQVFSHDGTDKYHDNELTLLFELRCFF